MVDNKSIFRIINLTMDPKKEKKEEKECKMTKLHNVCQEMKISPPVFTFQELVSKSSAKGGVTTWQGQASFLDEVIRGEGNDKKSVKENISVKILTDIEEGKFGGALRTIVLPPLHSSSPPGPKKKTFRGRRGKGNIIRSRNKMIDKYQIDVLICSNCSYKNYTTFTTCLQCRNDLVAQPTVNVFADLDRVTGDLKSDPLSVAFFVPGHQITMDKEKEVIVTPVGEDPKRNDYTCWKIHKMYVEKIDGVKVVKKRTKLRKDDPILPSLPSIEAANELIAFLSSFGSKNMNLLYHGEDHLSLLPFLERAGVKDEFDDLVMHLINTQDFFKQVQKDKPFGMKRIVADWGDESTKKLYLEGAHGALTDAICLAKICYCSGLKTRFEDWLGFEEFKKCLQRNFK